MRQRTKHKLASLTEKRTDDTEQNCQQAKLESNTILTDWFDSACIAARYRGDVERCIRNFLTSIFDIDGVMCNVSRRVCHSMCAVW